jgi:pimeloyl-ACP methyl ester carboxylesterase
MPGERKSAPPAMWDVRDRSGLGRKSSSDGSPSIERFVSVPFDPSEPDRGRFDLYYFVLSSRVAPTRGTVIFCAGGPGQIVRADTLETTAADFLYDNGYNVLHFHLRGSGYSQFPPSGDFDVFLRTRFAVEDIEAIRQDYMGADGRWDAIIARSYGTVLAQQYARFHAIRVKKLILLSALSRHMFKRSPKGNSADAVIEFDRLSDDVRRIQRESLQKIFNSSDRRLQTEFGDLRKDEEKEMIEAVFGSAEDTTKQGLFTRAEDAFGSLQFIVDKYDELENKGLLKKYKIDGLGRDFFRCLRDLRLVGSLFAKGVNQEDRQLVIGKSIRDALLAKRAGIELRNHSSATGRFPGLQRYDNQSQRVLYTMGVFDGTNPRFLREYFAPGRERDLSQVVRSTGGIANTKNKKPINDWLDKIHINKKDKIEPWDPADYSHSVPTLILNGTADPVTAGGQSEHIFKNALNGHRTLIEFPDVGHDLELPEPDEEDCRPLLSGVIHVPMCRINPGEAVAVTARVDGRELDKDLFIELKLNPNLPPELRHRGHGVLSMEFLKKFNLTQDEADILLVIENTSSRRSKEVKTYWNFTRSYYSGKVLVPIPSIAGKSTKVVFGKIIDGIKNSKKEPRLTAQRDSEKGLELFGYAFAGGDGLELWLRNNSDRNIDAMTRTWSIASDKQLIGKIKFDAPEIEPGKVAKIEALAIEGLGNFARGAMKLKAKISGRAVQACIVPPRLEEEYDRESFAIGLVNAGKTTIAAAGQEKWTAENYAFSASLAVQHGSISSNEGVVGKAKFLKMIWKPWLTIFTPQDCEAGITLAGFNIRGPNSIQLLILNDSPSEIVTKARDWVYVDPNDDPDNENASDEEIKSACLKAGKILDGLIYSFLVMNPEQFNNEKNNKILGILRRVFQESNLSVSIKHS